MVPENSPNRDNNNGATSLRLLRPSVVVLCGPAGSGKSTFAQRHFRPTQIISSDWARAHICDDERDQRFNDQAFALAHFLVEQRLKVNRLCVVDSTALTPEARRELLSLAKRFDAPTTLIVLDVPLEKCVERDGKRERSLGSAVVERQHKVLEQSRAAIREEGFDQVVELKEHDLEHVRIDILFRPITRTVPRPQRPDGTAPRRFDRPPSDARWKSPGDKTHTPANHSVPAGTPTPPLAKPVTATPGVAKTDKPSV
jgi:predicted kinase